MTCTWRSIARSLLPYTVSLRRFCASAHLHLHCAPSPSQLPDSCYTRKLVDVVVPSYSLGQKAAFVYLILLSMSMSMSMSTWTWTLISIGSWHTFPNQAVASSPVHGRFLFSSLTCSPAHQRAHRSGIDYIARRRWFNVSDTAGGSIILFLTSSQQPCLSLVALLAHHGPGDTTIGHLDSRYSKSPDHGSPIRNMPPDLYAASIHSGQRTHPNLSLSWTTSQLHLSGLHFGYSEAPSWHMDMDLLVANLCSFGHSHLVRSERD